MKKFWIGGGMVLLLAVGGGLLFLVSNLNELVAQVIEKEGSKMTATDVAVSGVDISPREGRGELRDLTIASPADFAAAKAFRLGQIVMDIDVESLRNDPIVIEEIRVLAPVVSAEVHEDGSNNIGRINENVQAYAARFGADSGAGAGDQGNDNTKRIRIKRFVFEEGRIEVDASALGLEPRVLDLPSIRLDDIGGPQGAAPSEIVRAVLGSLTRKAAAEVARTEIQEKVKDAVAEEAEKQAKKLLGRISG